MSVIIRPVVEIDQDAVSRRFPEIPGTVNGPDVEIPVSSMEQVMDLVHVAIERALRDAGLHAFVRVDQVDVHETVVYAPCRAEVILPLFMGGGSVVCDHVSRHDGSLHEADVRGLGLHGKLSWSDAGAGLTFRPFGQEPF